MINRNVIGCQGELIKAEGRTGNRRSDEMKPARGQSVLDVEKDRLPTQQGVINQETGHRRRKATSYKRMADIARWLLPRPGKTSVCYSFSKCDLGQATAIGIDEIYMGN